jgi:hypothetical protein
MDQVQESVGRLANTLGAAHQAADLQLDRTAARSQAVYDQMRWDHWMQTGAKAVIYVGAGLAGKLDIGKALDSGFDPVFQARLLGDRRDQEVTSTEAKRLETTASGVQNYAQQALSALQRLQQLSDKT